MRTNRSLALLLAVGCAAVLGACASEEPVPEPRENPGIFVTTNGDVLSGWMNVEVFRVPPGQRVMVDESFSVHASRYICIEGDMVMQDRSLEDPRTNAPDLRLASEEEILITGRIIGGRGRSFGGVPPENCAGQPGGDGSSIYMAAPRYLMLGALVAGRGGRGGAGASGGDGGSIDVLGDLVDPAQYVYIDRARIKQLAASDAGFYGGAGGAAGESWNGSVGSPGRTGVMTSASLSAASND